MGGKKVSLSERGRVGSVHLHDQHWRRVGGPVPWDLNSWWAMGDSRCPSKVAPPALPRPAQLLVLPMAGF